MDAVGINFQEHLHAISSLACSSLVKQCLQSLNLTQLGKHKCAKDFNLPLAISIKQELAREENGKFSKKLKTMKIAHSCVKTKALMDVASILVESASSWLENMFSSNPNHNLTKVKLLHAM
jgi:hypothetical protein